MKGAACYGLLPLLTNRQINDIKASKAESIWKAVGRIHDSIIAYGAYVRYS